MPRHDLTSRRDIERLVDAFYLRVRDDERLGPIFDGVAQVDWAAHLPRMYDFWDAVLFGTAGFKGNPLAVHQALAQRVPLTSQHFGRWLELFAATVDDLFAGPMAEEATHRAQRIALVMQHHLSGPLPATLGRAAQGTSTTASLDGALMPQAFTAATRTK